MSENKYGLCFVDEVEVEQAETGKVRLKIRGSWPTPAWRLDHEEVDVSGNKITIKIVGVSRMGVVAPAVIVPFEHVIEVKGLKAKDYVIEVIGRERSVYIDTQLR